jgi:hypothetical protein
MVPITMTETRSNCLHVVPVSEQYPEPCLANVTLVEAKLAQLVFVSAKNVEFKFVAIVPLNITDRTLFNEFVLDVETLIKNSKTNIIKKHKVTSIIIKYI